jgi:hypothetical protein
VLYQGDACALWPKDGQMDLGDLDQDGRPEVWFAADAGNLWRYDPGSHEPPVRVLQVEGKIGPIACVVKNPLCPPFLLLGYGRNLIRLVRQAPVGSVAGRL